MENITRTVYGSYLQTCMLQQLPFTVFANSTLNEKFSIAADLKPDAGTLPGVRYFGIGNGGHTMSIGQGGIAKPEPVQHRATDAALYNHLPFVLREIDNDLTPVQRAKYGLRRKEVHNGKTYIAYYLKRIDLTNTVPGMEYITVENDNTVVTPFVPDSSNLNPVPPDLSAVGVNVVSGDYTAATAKNALVFDLFDIQELLNVAMVLYEDDNYAIVSEIALVSGVDKVIASPAVGNSTINFTDVIAAQVVSHVNAFVPAKFSNNGTEVLLDLGATEPLFALQGVSGVAG